MTDTADYDPNIQLAADLVAAYVSNNSLSCTELPGLIVSVHAALTGFGKDAGPVTEVAFEKPTPAEIKKSIRPDALISFIDGKPYQTLKRHLGKHGLDPHTYRQRYGLGSDYPMVSPAYAQKRSDLAKSIGLGRAGGASASAANTLPA